MKLLSWRSAHTAQSMRSTNEIAQEIEWDVLCAALASTLKIQQEETWLHHAKKTLTDSLRGWIIRVLAGSVRHVLAGLTARWTH